MQGYDCMLKSYRQGRLNKHLAAWFCCMTDNPMTDYYLCQHCRNFALISETDHFSRQDKTTRAGWGNLDRLRKAFLNLSQDQRMVIHLKIVKGLSNHEIANTLSKPIGAVKAIQNQGLRCLLHLLNSGKEYIIV